MAEVAPTQAVVSPEPEHDLAHERALDAKLAAAAARLRAQAEANPAATGVGTLAERIVQRFGVAHVPTGASVPPDSPRGDRIPASEGDPAPREEAAHSLRALLIPPRFPDASFASYVAESKSQEIALRAVQQWTDAARRGDGRMLALIGRQGTGKSHLLYAALAELIGARVSLYARPWYWLADELRYGGPSPFAPSKTLEAHEVRQMLWKHRVVLLDEVRPTASTAFDDTELAKFACHAYDWKTAVLITTNVAPLEDVMGPAAASRFVQVTLDGRDSRQS